MIPLPYAKLIGAGVIVLALSLATYKVYDAGRDSVQVRWDAEKAIQEAALRAATEATARVENERKKLAQEVQDVLKPKLAATESANRDLARRLLSYTSRPRSTLPPVPGSAPSAARSPGDGDDEGAPFDRISEALNDHLSACDRDSIRLLGFQEWYQLMRGAVP